MSIIADSSALICMAKIGRLELLRKLYRRVVITQSVHNEVLTEGKRLHKPGVEEMEKAVEAGWIKISSLATRQLHDAEMYRASGGMGKGEAESIALARSKRIPLILDDKYARELAVTLGLNFLGTAAVLLEARLAGLISKKEFLESLRELAKVMWLSPEVAAELMRLAEEVKE
ncbi:MAG: hypothetical protein FJZ93_09140 [Chloroflexi bacterium]|nr:hypothetical protein [Chloroflexota bacterium]